MTMRTITDFPRNEAGLVDKFIGTAYDIVKYVSDNMGILDFIYNFLNTYGVLLTVDSIDELKATPIAGKYARVYTFSATAGYGYTDYLYVDDNPSGVKPNDPNATGSWIVVASSNSGGGSDGSGTGYIPWVYAQGSALGGETTIAVPADTVGVPFIVIEGFMNTVGYGFTYDVTTLTVTLAQPLEAGDEVVLLLTGTPAVPGNPNVDDWVQINWLYNGGSAVGGEQVIVIPYTFESVPAIYKNGSRYYAGLASQSYTIDAANQRILLTEPLATNDRLIVSLGGESTTLIMSDRTLQEVARAANVKDSETILSTNTVTYLNGIKIVYDVVAQKAYGLPVLPTNVYINSVTNGQLTYSPGNITVDLLPIPNEYTDKLRSDLLSSTGTDRVSYPASGTQVRTVTSKLDEVRSIKDFYAVGDGITNDDSAFAQASAWLAVSMGRRLYIPSGVYLLTQTFVVPTSSIIEGDGWTSTVIKFMGTDVPAIARSNWSDINATGGERITLRNIKVEDYSPSRTTNWIIDFTNSRYIRLENLWITDPNYGTTAVTHRYGVMLGRHPDGTYTGDTFVPVVWRCRFNQTFLHINTTDWYVSECELWGNGRSYAFQMRAGGSLTNNQLVGGSVCAVLIHANGSGFLETVRILGNYFDGSYTNINSGAGIKVDTGTNIHNAIISNNSFWHQNNEGIKCDGTIYRSVISNNVFDNCDADDTGSSDMVFEYSSLNVFSNNVHARNTAAPKTGVARVNKGKPLSITNNFSGLIDRITTCVCHDQGLYNASTYADTTKVIVSQSSSIFGTNYNSDSLSVKGNLTTQDLKTITSSGIWYIPNLATIVGAPSGATAGVAKLEVNFITANYCIQELTKPATGQKWVAIMDSGVWSSWSAV